jgi:hypothetical protein
MPHLICSRAHDKLIMLIHPSLMITPALNTTLDYLSYLLASTLLCGTLALTPALIHTSTTWQKGV